MSQKEFVKPVGLETPYRLFNLGGTAFVESKQGDDLDIMPASWNCPLDYDKMTVVIDSTHYSRTLLSKIICSLTLASTFTVNPGPRKLKVINKPLLIK